MKCQGYKLGLAGNMEEPGIVCPERLVDQNVRLSY